MNRIVFLFILLISTLSGRDLFAIRFADHKAIQDSSRSRQILFNGHLWRNSYFSIKGDPYFQASRFVKGSVRISGHYFTDVDLKYDICSDELLVLKDSKDIIQLNKEMTESFSFSYAGKQYRFVRLPGDTLKYFSGYLNELYNGETSLYVKYSKEIENFITGQYLGEFRQIHHLFIVRNNKAWPVKNLSDICKVLEVGKPVMRSFMKKNRIQVTARDPESFVPILKYFDSAQGKL